jgi:hypothetical protein
MTTEMVRAQNYKHEDKGIPQTLLWQMAEVAEAATSV